MKVVSKSGIAIGKIGNNNKVIQNNKADEKSFPWIKIALGVLAATATIIAAIIMS